MRYGETSHKARSSKRKRVKMTQVTGGDNLTQGDAPLRQQHQKSQNLSILYTQKSKQEIEKGPFMRH